MHCLRTSADNATCDMGSSSSSKFLVLQSQTGIYCRHTRNACRYPFFSTIGRGGDGVDLEVISIRLAAAQFQASS